MQVFFNLFFIKNEIIYHYMKLNLRNNKRINIYFQNTLKLLKKIKLNNFRVH